MVGGPTPLPGSTFVTEQSGLEHASTKDARDMVSNQALGDTGPDSQNGSWSIIADFVSRDRLNPEES